MMDWDMLDLDVSPDPLLEESFLAARASMKCLGLDDDDDDDSGDSTEGYDKTTLMIRNIPRKYTQSLLLRDLQDVCDITSLLDFFFLPADLGTGRNLGYCFINFVKGSHAVLVKQQLHKVRLFPGAKSGLTVGFADVQGYDQNLCNVRRSLLHRIKNREYRPLIAAGDELVPLTLSS